jgi:hypothetical protein
LHTPANFSLVAEVMLFQQFLEQLAVVSWYDDVMIAYRLGEEVCHAVLVVKSDELLCTAKVGFCLVPDEFAFSNEVS